jgi:predicted permease
VQQDFRVALRAFRRQPALYATAAIGLALAIGISTAIFSLVNVSAIRGFGVRDADRILRATLDNALRSPDSRGGFAGEWTLADVQTLRAAATSGDIAAQRQSYQYRLSFTDGPETHARVDAITGNFFDVLGVRPPAGRLLAPADDEPGAPRVVVLSHAFWSLQLGGDPAAIGREVAIEGVPFVVCGIAERRFAFAPPPYDTAPAVWIPLAADANLFAATVVKDAEDRRRRLAALRAQATLLPHEREAMLTLERQTRAATPTWRPGLTVLARPKAGVPLAQLTGELESIARAIGASRGQAPAAARTAVQLRSIEALQTSTYHARQAAMLMGAAMLVLVLGGANLANALLAAALARRRDVGVQLVLGAGRWRVLRQSLVESLLVAGTGGAGGWLLAGWVASVFGALMVTDPLIDFSPDRTVLLYSLGMTLAVALTGGIVAARQSSRIDVIGALKADQQAAPGLRSAIRSALVGAQAAISIVVLLVAAVLARGLHHAATLDVGVDLDRFVRIQIGLSGYDEARAAAYWAAALDRVREQPAVAAAALAVSSPFDGTTGPARLANGRVGLHQSVADAAFFEVLQVRVLRGRTFAPDEIRMLAPVAVISERLAREFWGSDDPVGDTLDRIWGPQANYWSRPNVHVIGVVSDVLTALDRASAPFIYQPDIGCIQNCRLIVRARDDPSSVVAPVLAVLRSIDPEQRPGVYFMRDGWRRQLEWPSRHAAVGSLVALTALGLAVVGLVGVATFTARQRRHEVSVRTALGARTADVVRLLCVQSLRPVVIGLGIGALASFWINPVLERYVAGYGISVYDPIAFAAGTLALLGTAALATFVPARRAARVDPAQLLRSS